MSRCPTFNFQVSILSKWLAKHIRSTVSFKITIKKRCFHWHSLTLKVKTVFLFGNLRNERSKIISLPSFHLVTRLNSQNRNETSLLMNSDTLICIWIFAFPIGIIQVSTPKKWIFLLYFSSLHDYWLPTTLISLVHNSLAKWRDVKNVLFSFSKCEKWKSA